MRAFLNNNGSPQTESHSKVLFERKRKEEAENERKGNCVLLWLGMDGIKELGCK